MKKIIGISLGDIAGIGPEIVVKALDNPEIYKVCNPLVIGNEYSIQKALLICKKKLKLNRVLKPQDGLYSYGTIDYIDIDFPGVEGIETGKVQEKAGRYAYTLIEESTGLALNNKIDAIVTAPINKKSINIAGIPYIGHHEIFESLCDLSNPLITMFQVKNLKVFFLTRHLSLIEAIKAIKKEFVFNNICRDISALKMLTQKPDPSLAIAAVNPHAGDCGMFGNEEIDELSPAIEKAKLEGLNVVGPIAADSVFNLALIGKYDAVLSLYHDQGHIATKMVDFEKTVAVTIGLPFIRTSVDHGTAFNISGKGIASSISLEEAIKLAALYANTYKEI
jgi:4-phospho-D-threonate 3-dehydrogenase / 4-phospho-D-erythronate 3-dehydrogenase